MSRQEELLSDAESMFSEARYLADGEKYLGALSRSYYAAFNAVKAMLLSKGSEPRTHQGVASEFGKLFREEVGPELTRDYSELQRMRELADYGSGKEFDREDVQFAIGTSENILQHARKTVEKED